MQHMGGDPYFQTTTAATQRWVALAGALLGEQASAQEPEWFNKPPGTPTAHAAAPGQLLLQPQAAQRADDLDGPRPGRRRQRLPALRRRLAPPRHPAARPSNVLGFSQGITDYGPPRTRPARCRSTCSPATSPSITARRSTAPSRTAPPTATAGPSPWSAKGVSCRRDEEGFARYQAALKQHEQWAYETSMGSKT